MLTYKKYFCITFWLLFKTFIACRPTTFLKARLNCSIAGDYPFYYNHIKSAYYLEGAATVYASFTTGENEIGGMSKLFVHGINERCPGDVLRKAFQR